MPLCALLQAADTCNCYTYVPLSCYNCEDGGRSNVSIGASTEHQLKAFGFYAIAKVSLTLGPVVFALIWCLHYSVKLVGRHCIASQGKLKDVLWWFAVWGRRERVDKRYK